MTPEREATERLSKLPADVRAIVEEVMARLDRATRARAALLLAEITEQAQWILDHGGDEAGYVRRYGRGDSEDKFGDGGELIFKADNDKLQSLLHSAYRQGILPGVSK